MSMSLVWLFGPLLYLNAFLSEVGARDGDEKQIKGFHLTDLLSFPTPLAVLLQEEEAGGETHRLYFQSQNLYCVVPTTLL